MVGGLHVAIDAARAHRTLRQLGVSVRKTIDEVIVSQCIESDYGLLHTDRDFEPFVKHLGVDRQFCARVSAEPIPLPAH